MKKIATLVLLFFSTLARAQYNTGLPMPPISISGPVNINQSGIPVTITGSSTLPVTILGKAASLLIRNNYSLNSIVSGSYSQLVSASPSASEVEIFDSSGQTLVLAFGSAGNEANQVYIFPGGNGRIPLNIPVNTRLSAKAISADAVSGELDINLYK